MSQHKITHTLCFICFHLANLDRKEFHQHCNQIRPVSLVVFPEEKTMKSVISTLEEEQANRRSFQKVWTIVGEVQNMSVCLSQKKFQPPFRLIF